MRGEHGEEGPEEGSTPNPARTPDLSPKPYLNPDPHLNLSPDPHVNPSPEPQPGPQPQPYLNPDQANNTVQLSDGMFGEGVASAAATKVATGGGGVVTLDLDDTMDF